MVLTKIIMIVGVWIGVLGFLGFPETWKKILYIITGIAVIILARFILKSFKKRDGGTKEIATETFTEHRI